MKIKTPQSRFTGYIVLFVLFGLVVGTSLALNLRPEIAEVTTFITLFGYLGMRRRFQTNRKSHTTEMATSC